MIVGEYIDALYKSDKNNSRRIISEYIETPIIKNNIASLTVMSEGTALHNKQNDKDNAIQ